jgi:hypothetical protein
MKGVEGAGPRTSRGIARGLKIRKREWHEINRDERRGRIRATNQLRYSKSLEKCKERFARDQ